MEHEVLKKTGATLLTAKAFNCRIISEWLARCLTDAARQPRIYADDRMPLLASCVTLVQVKTKGLYGYMPWLQAVPIMQFSFAA